MPPAVPRPPVPPPPRPVPNPPRTAARLAPALAALAGSAALTAATFAGLPARVEDGYSLFASPRRTIEEVAAVRATLPAVSFELPPTDWSRLPHTRAALTGGGRLRITAVGDSIVNDTMRSGWVHDLRAAYPDCDIEATALVRGCGGCRHYREENRVRRYVVPTAPDLVLIGGISQRKIGAVRDVIRQLRGFLPEVEILLTTGTFGPADPRDPAALNAARYAGGGAWGRTLRRLADAEAVAYLDATTPWAEAVRSTGLPPGTFYRDPVHANERGEQLAGAVLTAFFAGGGRSEFGG